MKTYIVIISTVLLFAFSACSKSAQTVSTAEISATPALIRGDLTENAYENSFLNLIFELPEAWRFEAVEDLINFSQTHELSTTHGLAPAPGAHETSFFEFYAKDYLGGVNSLIFVIENMEEYDKTYTEKDITDMLTEQYYSLSNVDYIVGESYTVKVSGVEMTALQVFEENTRLYQRHLLCQKDHLMLSFTATASTEEALDKIIGNLEFQIT